MPVGLVLSLVLPLAAQDAVDLDGLRRAAHDRVDAHAESLYQLSNRIWRFAETSLTESRSAKALADFLEERGFVVERGIAGIPTAFTATWGSGEPVIGILAEFDALPGISNVATTDKAPLVRGGAGHGCGHHSSDSIQVFV